MPKELCNRCSGFGCPDCRATGFQIAPQSPDCRFCGGNAWIAIDHMAGHAVYSCGSCKAIRWFHPKKAKYVQDRANGPVNAPATATTQNGAIVQTVASSTVQPQQVTFATPPTQQSLYPYPCVCGLSDQWTHQRRRASQNPTGTVRIESDWVCSNCGNSTTVVQNP